MPRFLGHEWRDGSDLYVSRLSARRLYSRVKGRTWRQMAKRDRGDMINGMPDDISFITLLVMLVIGFALAYIILHKDR